MTSPAPHISKLEHERLAPWTRPRTDRAIPQKIADEVANDDIDRAPVEQPERNPTTMNDR